METNQEGKYPEGHFVGLWMGIGIAVFSGLGIPLAIVTGNHGLMGVGPGLGVAFGVGVGQSIENKYKKAGKIRPLNQVEKKRKRIAIVSGLVVLAAFLVFFLFR